MLLRRKNEIVGNIAPSIYFNNHLSYLNDWSISKSPHRFNNHFHRIWLYSYQRTDSNTLSVPTWSPLWFLLVSRKTNSMHRSCGVVEGGVEEPSGWGWREKLCLAWHRRRQALFRPKCIFINKFYFHKEKTPTISRRLRRRPKLLNFHQYWWKVAAM